jgi:phosphoheptose isomerase
VVAEKDVLVALSTSGDSQTFAWDQQAARAALYLVAFMEKPAARSAKWLLLNVPSAIPSGFRESHITITPLFSHRTAGLS